MNRFVDEYELWCNEGKNPDIASIDLDFALDLQKKRLDEKGVKIQTAFTDKETVKNEVPINACTAYDMGECKSNIASKTYEVTEKYFKDGKKKKKIKDRFFFYTMITRLENRNSEVACSCPNCGAVSSVRELLNGCKNCKTRFIMDDLFPKVTNFYFVKTYSLANKSTKKVLAPYLLGGIAAVAAFTVWVVVKDGTFDIDGIWKKSDEEAIKELSSLQGIGVWTAEMILLFCMQRPNVLSFGDLAIQRGMRMVYHHRKIDRKLFEKYRRRLSPYCSVASLYFWAVAGGSIPGMKDFAPKKQKRSSNPCRNDSLAASGI